MRESAFGQNEFWGFFSTLQQTEQNLTDSEQAHLQKERPPTEVIVLHCSALSLSIARH